MEPSQASGLTSISLSNSTDQEGKQVASSANEELHQKRFQIWRQGFDGILSRVIELEKKNKDTSLTENHSNGTLNTGRYNAHTEKTTVDPSSCSHNASARPAPPLPLPDRGRSNSVNVNLVLHSSQCLGQDSTSPSTCSTVAPHGVPSNGYVGVPRAFSAKTGDTKLDILEKMMEEFDKKGSVEQLFTNQTNSWEGGIKLKDYMLALKNSVIGKFQPTEAIKNLFHSYVCVQFAAAIATDSMRKIKKDFIKDLLDAKFKNLQKEFNYGWIKRNFLAKGSSGSHGNDDFCELSLLKAYGKEWEEYYEEKMIEKMGPYRIISEQLKKYEDMLQSLLDEDVCCDEAKLEAYTREHFGFVQPILEQDVSQFSVGEKILQIVEDISESLNRTNAERFRNEVRIAQKAIRHALAKYCEILEPKLVQPLHHDTLSSLLNQAAEGIVESFYQVQGFIYTQPWIDKKADLMETLQREHMEFVRVNNTNLTVQKIEVESMIQSYITTLRRQAIKLLSGDCGKPKIVEVLNSIISDGAADLKSRYPNRAEEIIAKLRSRAVETMNTLAINDPFLVTIKLRRNEGNGHIKGNQHFSESANTSDPRFTEVSEIPKTEAANSPNAHTRIYATTTPQHSTFSEEYTASNWVSESSIPLSDCGGTGEMETEAITSALQGMDGRRRSSDGLQQTMQSSISANPVPVNESMLEVRAAQLTSGHVLIPAARRRVSAPGPIQRRVTQAQSSPIIARFLRSSIPLSKSPLPAVTFSGQTETNRVFRPIHQIVPVRRQLTPPSVPGKRIFLMSGRVSNSILAADSPVKSPRTNPVSGSVQLPENAYAKATISQPASRSRKQIFRTEKGSLSTKRVESDKPEPEVINLEECENPKVSSCPEPSAKKRKKTRKKCSKSYHVSKNRKHCRNRVEPEAISEDVEIVTATAQDHVPMSATDAIPSPDQIHDNQVLMEDLGTLDAIGTYDHSSFEDLLSTNTTNSTDKLWSNADLNERIESVNEPVDSDNYLGTTTTDRGPPDMNMSISSIGCVASYDTMSLENHPDADDIAPIDYPTSADDSTNEPTDDSATVAGPIPEANLPSSGISNASTNTTTDYSMPILSPMATEDLIARAESVLGLQSDTETDSPPELSSTLEDFEDEVNAHRIEAPLAQSTPVRLPNVPASHTATEGHMITLANTCPEPEVNSTLLKTEPDRVSDFLSNSSVSILEKLKHHSLSKLKLSSPYGVGIFFCESKVYIAVTVYKTVRSFTLSSKIRLLKSDLLPPELILDSEPNSPEFVTLDVYLFLTESEFAETEENFGWFEKISKPLWAEEVLATFLHKVMDEIQTRWTKDITPDFITIGLPTFVSSRCKKRLKTALSLAGLHNSVFVQATTGIGVSYLRSPITSEEHYCLAVYIEDMVQDVALLKVQDRRFTVIATEGSVCLKQEVPVTILNNVTLAINSVIATAGIAPEEIRYCACVLEIEEKSRAIVNGQEVLKTVWAGTNIKNDLPENCELEIFSLSEGLLGGLIEISESRGISGILKGRYSEVFPCGIKIRRVKDKTKSVLEVVTKNNKAADAVVRIPVEKLGAEDKRSPICCYHLNHMTVEVEIFASASLRSNDPKAAVKVMVSSEGIISAAVETSYQNVRESDYKKEIWPYTMPTSDYRKVKHRFEEFIVASRERKYRVPPPKKAKQNSSKRS